MNMYLALSEKPRKASCMVENWMTLISLYKENTVLNCEEQPCELKRETGYCSNSTI